MAAPMVIDLTGDDDGIIEPPASASVDDRPAKRVKLTQEDTRPSLALLSRPLQNIAQQYVDDGLTHNPQLQKAEVRQKVAEDLLKKYGPVWPRDDDFDISMAELRDIALTCEESIKQFAAATLTAAIPAPAPAPAPAESQNKSRAPPMAPAPPTTLPVDSTSSPADLVSSLLPRSNASEPQPPAANHVIDLTEEDNEDAIPAATTAVSRRFQHEQSPPQPSSSPLPTLYSPPRKRTPTSPTTPKGIKVLRGLVDTQGTSPQNFRSRAKKAEWKTDTKKSEQQEAAPSTHFGIVSRPYLTVKDRKSILRSNGRLCRLGPDMLQSPEVFHVDFRLDEVQQIRSAVRELVQQPPRNDDPYKDLFKLLHKLKPRHNGRAVFEVTKRIAAKIPHRTHDDLYRFLADVYNKRPLTTTQCLSISRDAYDKRAEDFRESRLSSLLLARETSGNSFGSQSLRRLENFTNEFRKCLEDGLEIRSEFTNCAGDISTISWISNHVYIAGTTVHMDSHNQQYNKPGNLVLGSVSRGSATLQAYPDHRIVRPLVEKGENSTAAMRASQDPWLYTSVVSSDYDPIHNRTYTSGFDKKVKVWSVDKSGALMTCLGTWDHDGNVNFVQASAFRPPATEGMYGYVATAADIHVDAVRIYKVNSNSDVAQSTFRSFSCSRIMNADNTVANVDKWTYFPSTMKWGIEDSVKHLLLVGYSPRSRTDDDRDIPVDRLNTGELCLWDVRTGQTVLITSAKTQNVFEVLWHPSQPVFIAATSPIMLRQDVNIRTQVRIFRRTELGHFSEAKTLDCMASDINELTIAPNCERFCYVTAGCTDGKTYVWDTAISDKPIHILAHGPAVEGVRRNDDEDDTGIKFTAWGTSLDRFYTGSSDGVVKVWNVRTSGKPAKGRVILEAPAQISFGVFSPDKTKLVIGDASGRVFILSVDEEDGKPASFTNLAGPARRRIPNQVTLHPEPSPPADMALSDADNYLEMVRSGQLRYSGDPTVGMVQGLNYTQSQYFCREAHNEREPAQPLEAHLQVLQQEQYKMYSNPPSRTRSLRTVPWNKDSVANIVKQHLRNSWLDLRFQQLSLEMRHALSLDGVEERELAEGVQYVGVEEDDEAHLKEAKCEVVREELGHEERFWV